MKPLQVVHHQGIAESLSEAAFTLLRGALQARWSAGEVKRETQQLMAMWMEEETVVSAGCVQTWREGSRPAAYDSVRNAWDRTVWSAVCLRKQAEERHKREARRRRESAKAARARCLASVGASCGSAGLLRARLARLLDAAERRLQELVRECDGERKKASASAEARVERTRSKAVAASMTARRDASWALFLLRLENETARASFSPVFLDTDWMNAASNALVDRPAALERLGLEVNSLSPDLCATVTGAVLQTRPTAARGTFPHFSDADALADALDLDRSPSARVQLKKETGSEGTNREKLAVLNTFLTIEPIEWLVHASPSNCFSCRAPSDTWTYGLLRSRVYVRVDEEAATVSSSSSSSPKMIRMENVTYTPGKIAHLLETPFIDALAARRDALDAAPNGATLAALKQLCGPMVEIGRARTLYGILGPAPGRNGSPKVREGSPFVAPLASAGLRLLLDALVPRWLFSPLPAASLAPLAVPDNVRLLSLIGPRLGVRTPNGESLLVAWSRKDDESHLDVATPMLAVCHWRACSNRAVIPVSNKCRLCAWHSLLKSFLDLRRSSLSSKAAESARYLSTAGSKNKKKSKETYWEDTDTNRARLQREWPLLAELANAKLGATVKLFCGRAAAESKTSFHEDAPLQPEPRWLRWTDAKALTDARSALDHSLEVAETVAAVERAAGAEIAAAHDAGAPFPDKALHRIKQEHTRLGQERNASEEEEDDNSNFGPSATGSRNIRKKKSTLRAKARDERFELDFARRKLVLLRAARAGNSSLHPSRQQHSPVSTGPPLAVDGVVARPHPNSNISAFDPHRRLSTSFSHEKYLAASQHHAHQGTSSGGASTIVPPRRSSAPVASPYASSSSSSSWTHLS